MDESLAPQQVLQVPVWAWLVVVIAAAGIYALSLDNGMVLSRSAHVLHEFFHDGRHFLAVPCH